MKPSKRMLLLLGKIHQCQDHAICAFQYCTNFTLCLISVKRDGYHRWMITPFKSIKPSVEDPSLQRLGETLVKTSENRGLCLWEFMNFRLILLYRAHQSSPNFHVKYGFDIEIYGDNLVVQTAPYRCNSKSKLYDKMSVVTR